MMPGIDGYEVCKKLRANPRTAHCAVVMVTAKTMPVDTIVGLAAGADDYIAKPFDPAELVARLRSVLRRARQLRDVSPLTGLPGNTEIRRMLDALIETGDEFALIHADIDQFKAFNDRYGFARGDDAIKATADVLLDAVDAATLSTAFVGHVGGDDFALLVPASGLEAFCEDIVRRFDAMAPTLYDPEDAAAGGIEVVDRKGATSRVGRMTLSLGVAVSGVRRFGTSSEVVATAAEMKSAAKHEGRSTYSIDRRSG